ncbi:hypothetical protein B0J14DRAFT_288142 [Halenospora varia]|nr:hypothetical protein B0J14DRAFT_288142 [Halenospora varia]
MTIHDLIPGVTVEVLVDDVPLQEYADDELAAEVRPFGEVRPTRTASKYIEAITGKEVQIRISVSDEYKQDCPTLNYIALVDGEQVSNRLLTKDALACLGSHSSAVREARSTDRFGVSTLQPFIFSEIQTYKHSGPAMGYMVSN